MSGSAKGGSEAACLITSSARAPLQSSDQFKLFDWQDDDGG
jgi:hypothetical protein